MNHKSVFYFILTVVFLFSLFSCDKSEECHNDILLKNDYHKAIYYVSTLKEDFFNFNPTNENYAIDLKVEPGESKNVRIGLQLSCWEQVIANSGGYVYIYIYDAEYLELKTTDWQDAKNKYLKKYKLDVDQLKKMKWIISFSG